MKLLVLGGGGREHALIWKLANEPEVTEIVCVPGNAGIARFAHCIQGDLSSPKELLELARVENVDLTVVGPELPLSAGIADLFTSAGQLLFGPTRLAAELEFSKAFAKEFMTRHRIPTASYKICRDMESAQAVLTRGEFEYPIVIKADGLAAGKGVVVAPDRFTADQAIRTAMHGHSFGTAGSTLVLEEHLSGEEVSFFVLCDGRRSMPLPSAQDYKRIFDNDRGPNTGGMGAFAPSPRVTPQVASEVMDRIVEPVISGLRNEGREFRGFLYVGLMLTNDGPKVIEFNVRLGDPEAQVILPILEGDLTPLLTSAATGSLESSGNRFNEQAMVGVVLASAGYPSEYQTGKVIDGLEQAVQLPGVFIFHAGTARQDDRIVTSGGRVLTVVGMGRDYAEAINRAYAAADVISFDGKYIRSDIGQKALDFQL